MFSPASVSALILLSNSKPKLLSELINSFVLGESSLSLGNSSLSHPIKIIDKDKIAIRNFNFIALPFL